MEKFDQFFFGEKGGFCQKKKERKKTSVTFWQFFATK
jgi:hypothetical protein